MTTSSWYRRSVWMYKGNREYTRTGYEVAKTRFIGVDLDVDCSDRHYMITGSNSGIGLQVALEVARRGGIIHMVCRNEEAAKRARSEIITTTGNDKIHLHIVDLGRPREVLLWVERFAAQHDNLHVLVNNAGCMVHERRLDEDGIEVNFAVNTLSVHIITTCLLPLLQKSEDARVVMVSSAGLLTVRLDPHDLMHLDMEPFQGSLVYSQNKRQQVVMTLWYAQRYDKVHFSSMHPGWADTPALRTSIPEFYEMNKENLRTPAQGADTVVWLAISKSAIKHPSGLFYQDREITSTHLPLAWTKSSIEEEDLLMKNIHEIFLKVYERAHSPPTTRPSEEPEGDLEATAQDSTTSNPPTEETISQTETEEIKPDVEIVKIPPPPEPRRNEPQVTKISEEPSANEPDISVNEPAAPQPQKSQQPESSEIKVETEFNSQPQESKTPTASPEIKAGAELSSQPPSFETYVTPEKPKVEEIVATHNIAPETLEIPEATNQSAMETQQPIPTDTLTTALDDMKLTEESNQSSSDAPTQKSVVSEEIEIKEESSTATSP